MPRDGVETRGKVGKCTRPMPAPAGLNSPNGVVWHLLAGLGSGVASAVILQPLDLLKTRRQQAGRPSLSAVLRELGNSQDHLLASLWRGTVPSALRTGLGSALYFTTLNALRQNVSVITSPGAKEGTIGNRAHGHSSSLPRLSNAANMLTGALARTLAGFVLMPLTVIKVRYESSMYSYRSLGSATTDIYSSGGIRGFFSGFGATAVRDAPYAGLYVLLYEQLKRRLSSLATTYRVEAGSEASLQRLDDGLSASINFSSGILAGAGCSVISNPFDAVKTRIQLQPNSYRNMVHAARKMVAEDGVRSLWNGLMLRMSRKALSSALAWTVYEELIRKAEERWSMTELRGMGR